MKDEPVPTRRELMVLAALFVVAGALGTTIGVFFFGVPALPPPRIPTTPNGAGQVVDVSLAEWSITAAPAAVDQGSVVEFVVTNDGVLDHDFKVNGEVGITRLAPGTTARFRYGPIVEPTDAWCTILGHRDQGMQMSLGTTEPQDGG